ncbi:hypothetical protein [Actinoplanes sp. NPDC049265]|uniref:hypothetical protein n=1 Tax=Actinoplanes sp. NPDC049265 TaxID=3363902 RepID=UPI0037239927
MKFGIYPGGRAGTMCSRPSEPEAVGRLVDELAGGGPFVIREYVHYLGDDPAPESVAAIGAEHELTRLTMPDDWYARDGRELDLVASYLPPAADLPGWLRFLDRIIDRYGHLTRFLQVTLEPNFPVPLIDGSSPGVLDALTRGLPHARAALDRRGLGHVRVGFSVAEPAEWLGGDDAFWQHLAAIPGSAFAAHLDYVGLALYPDAFSPVAPEHVAPMTAHAIEQLRARIPAGVPIHVVENGSPSGAPIPLVENAPPPDAPNHAVENTPPPGAPNHLTENTPPTSAPNHLTENTPPIGAPNHFDENGSPTGRPRTEADQARSLRTMIETIRAAGVGQYELFGLRDADSGSPEPLGHLGLVTDAYRPKEAFAAYRDIVTTSLPTV